MATAAMNGGGGWVRWLRARERTEEGEELEGVRRVGGVAWRHGRGPGRQGEGGKQEVAGASPALATEQLRGEGEEDDREEEVGWASAASLGQVGR